MELEQKATSPIKEKESIENIKKRHLLGICNNCHKKIVNQPDYYVEIYQNTRTVYCRDCFNKREKTRRIKKYKRKGRRGIVRGVIVCALLICITNLFGFCYNGPYKLEILIALAISCDLIPMTVSTIFLENTLLSKIYLGVYSFGFVKIPLVVAPNSRRPSCLAILLVMTNVFVMSIVLITTFAICTLLSPVVFPIAIYRYNRGTHIPSL